MTSAPIPAAATTPTATTNSCDNGATSSSDFVAMFTQLLGNAEATLNPTLANATNAALNGDGKADTPSDAASLDAALADALAALFGAAPQVAAATTPGANDRTPAGEANQCTAQSMAVTGNMLASNATAIAHEAQAKLQSTLTTSTDTNAPDHASIGKDKSATPDGSANANGIGANNAQLQQPQVEAQIKERVGTGAWRDELGAKLTWMIERGVQTGSLRLSPENLGPLEVRISVHNDQATVWFGAAHAETRASLEQALPRLREMFAASGLSLADAGVFREPPKEAFKNNSNSYASRNDATIEGGIASIGTRNGLLDAYA